MIISGSVTPLVNLMWSLLAFTAERMDSVPPLVIAPHTLGSPSLPPTKHAIFVPLRGKDGMDLYCLMPDEQIPRNFELSARCRLPCCCWEQGNYPHQFALTQWLYADLHTGGYLYRRMAKVQEPLIGMFIIELKIECVIWETNNCQCILQTVWAISERVGNGIQVYLPALRLSLQQLLPPSVGPRGTRLNAWDLYARRGYTHDSKASHVLPQPYIVCLKPCFHPPWIAHPCAPVQMSLMSRKTSKFMSVLCSLSQGEMAPKRYCVLSKVSVGFKVIPICLQSYVESVQ